MKQVTTLLLCAAIFQLELMAVTGSHFHASAHFLRRLRGNNRRLVVDRRDATCTPYSEEYDRKSDALFCQESYIAAVKQEIEQSNCKNIEGDDSDYGDYFYDYDSSSPPCDFPTDDRENVRNCTEECSERQLLYVFCTTIGQQHAEIDKECGVDTFLYCGNDNGDFCLLKYNLTVSLLKKCSATSSMGGGEFECNDNCKNTVEMYVAESGCCVDFWKDYRDYSEEGSAYDGPTVSEVFSACDVDIPEGCNVNFNPPKELLDCARSTINRSSTQLGSVLIVLVSASIGYLIER
jgi:hypothetical protein